jgi:Transposase DDE domain
MRDLLWRVRFRWKLWPRQVTGDSKYGTKDNLVAIENQGIRAYIPIPDMDHRTAFFSSQEFTYDPECDVYVCPAGKDLRFDRPHSTERSRSSRARARDCNHCPLKAKCTTSKQGRSLCRSVDEQYLDRVRGYHATEPYKKALRKRQVWVEPLFAEAKDWHGMRRFRLRRLWRVNCEAIRIAAGQNLKRLLKKRGWGRRPFPAEAMSASFWVLLRDVLVFTLGGVVSGVDWFSFLDNQDAMRLSLLMSLVKTFSTGWCNLRRGRIICDAVDNAGFIIAGVEGPTGTNGQSDGAANSIIVVDEPACRKILLWTAYPAAGVQGNKDDFVAGRHATIPRAMKRNKESVKLPRKLDSTVERQVKWSRMSLHLDQRLYYAVAVASMAEIGVDDVT